MRRFSALIYILVFLASIPFLNFYITFSVAFGGAICLGNMACLETLLARLLGPETNPGPAEMMTSALLHLRFIFIAGALYIFMDAGWINFPALIIGLSVTVVSIFTWFFLINPEARTACG